MLSPLQLKHHAIQSVSIEENEKCDDQFGKLWIPEEPNVNVGIAFQANDPYTSRIILTINGIYEEDFAWKFSIKLTGYFEFTDKTTDTIKAQKLSAVNGSTMLYGIARDILYGLTTRGQKPTINLPSMNFMEVADRINEANTKKIEPKQKAKSTLRTRKKPE